MQNSIKKKISPTILTITLCLVLSFTIPTGNVFTQPFSSTREQIKNYDKCGIDLDQNLLSQIEGYNPLSNDKIHPTMNISALSFSGFIENQGQISNKSLKYYLTTDTFALGFLQSKLLVCSRLNGNNSWETISITFPGSSPTFPIGHEKLAFATNYFNQQPAVVEVASWAEVIYPDLYPGITMRFYCKDGALKYDFIVAPKVDPSLIQLKLQTSLAIEVEISPIKIICYSTETPELRLWEESEPVGFQEEGQEIEVTFHFQESQPRCYGFEIKSYDSSKILVIDPIILKFNTFFGGNGYDYGLGITIDAVGSVYITGHTNSSVFPTINAYQSTSSGYTDVFVSKLNPDGQSLNYSTYLGGSNTEEGHDIAVDSIGAAYITGYTISSNFPTVNAYDSTINGGVSAFVTKLSPDGQSLIFSTFLGGGLQDYSYGIFVDEIGAVYIAGLTSSSDFPTINAYDSTSNGNADVFMTKLNPDGQSLNFSTYLGGSGTDYTYGFAVDAVGSVYVTGTTDSSDFPTINALNSTSNGDFDIFVSKLNPDGKSLNYSTYLGGSDTETGREIAVDGMGAAYVTGYSRSSNFPTVNAYDMTFNGNADVFVTKLNPDGQSLNYSTYLGGSNSEYGQDITVDEIGTAYITGYSLSTNFPTINAYDSTFNENWDVFVTKLNPDGQALNYSTYLGGSGKDYGQGIAVDAKGAVYITGFTNSSNFPTINAYDSTYNGIGDVFVAKLITDTNSPSWEFIPINQVLIDNEPFKYQIRAADEFGIDAYWVNDTSSFEIDTTGLITNSSTLDIGVYYLRVSANDTTGNEISTSIEIIVIADLHPIASFTVSKTTVNIGETVSFFGNSTGGNLPISYSWNFGDGTSTTEQNPTHLYLSTGSYGVIFTVTDTDGDFTSYIVDIMITNPNASEPISTSPFDKIPGYSTGFIVIASLSVVLFLWKREGFNE